MGALLQEGGVGLSYRAHCVSMRSLNPKRPNCFEPSTLSSKPWVGELGFGFRVGSSYCRRPEFRKDPLS